MSRTKHPDVAGGGEPPEVDGLGGHPLDRQLTLTSLTQIIADYLWQTLRIF